MKFGNSLIILVFMLIFFEPVWGLTVTYNTTYELQFKGNDSFANQREVRVIFRAEPFALLPGESTLLRFVLENPTGSDHLVSINLFDVPPGFNLVEGEPEIQRYVQANSTDVAVFKLLAPQDVEPRSYFYGFDVVDKTLDEEGQVIQVEKRLGRYNAFTVTAALNESAPPGGLQKVNGDERRAFPIAPLTAALVLAFLYLFFRGRR